MSISNYAEKKILDALGNNTSFAVTSVWIKLHTGDPGETCTGSPATNAARKAVAFSTAATPGGTLTSSGAITWTSVPAAEDYSHFSLWDSSGPALTGNALWNGTITANAVSTGDTFTIASGGLVLTLS